MESPRSFPLDAFASAAEVLSRKRRHGLQTLQKLAIVQLGAAFLSVLIGILTLYFAWPNRHLPFVFGGPIFSGGIVFSGALMACLGARQGVNENVPSTKVKCLVICHYVICVTCTILCFVSSAFSIWGIMYCVVEDTKFHSLCLPNKAGNTAMMVLGATVGVLLAITCILGTCYFCLYGRTFGFRSRYEKRMEMQMMKKQPQMNAQSKAQATPPYKSKY